MASAPMRYRQPHRGYRMHTSRFEVRPPRPGGDWRAHRPAPCGSPSRRIRGDLDASRSETRQNRPCASNLLQCRNKSIRIQPTPAARPHPRVCIENYYRTAALRASPNCGRSPRLFSDRPLGRCPDTARPLKPRDGSGPGASANSRAAPPLAARPIAFPTDARSRQGRLRAARSRAAAGASRCRRPP